MFLFITGVLAWTNVGGQPLGWLGEGVFYFVFMVHGGNDPRRGCGNEFQYSLSKLERQVDVGNCLCHGKAMYYFSFGKQRCKCI